MLYYKYCNSDGFDILLNSRLKTTRASEFNDPFDLAFGIDFEETGSEKIEPGLTKKWILESIEKTMDSLNEKFGIACFSRCPDIIQMWSHYAENHRGIVIGLEEDEFVGDRAKLVEVKYRKDMVMLPYTASIPMSKQVEKEYEKRFRIVMGRKESGWSYEEEVRIYAELKEQDKDGNYYVEIPPSSIREIYLGLRSPETSEIIARALKQKKEFRHLKIFKMEKSTREYKLIPRLINT